MTKIFFISPQGYMPLKDETLRGMLHQSHGWQPDGVTWVYGVCIPKHGQDPNELADYLGSLGVRVVPGTNDPSPPALPAPVLNALAVCGVVATDSPKDIVRKMATASGMSVLRPHFF
jgi:hypothetical protein